MKFHKNLPCLKKLDSPTKAFLLNMEQLMIQDTLLEQENILEHKADMAHHVILRHIAHIYAADGNAAGRSSSI